MGWGLSESVGSAVDRAIDVVLETVAELQSGALIGAAEG